MIANKMKGQRGPDKDAHLKTSSLTCLVSPRSHHGFSQKRLFEFIKRVNDFFDCLNGHNVTSHKRFRNENLAPYTDVNGKRFQFCWK